MTEQHSGELIVRAVIVHNFWRNIWRAGVDRPIWIGVDCLGAQAIKRSAKRCTRVCTLP